MNPYKYIIPLGIATYTSLLITGFLGLSGLNYTIHKLMGITTLCLASLHGGLAFMAFLERKKRKKEQS